MKRYEKSFLFRNFLIFFSILELFLIVIFYFIYIQNENSLKEKLFYKMYNCSWTLTCKEFKYDIAVKKDIGIGLKREKNSFYSYFNIPNSKKYSLKISYSVKKYREDEIDFLKKLSIYFLIFTAILALIVFFISYYSLKPIREAFNINEEFIKDILHDINTPLSTIILNLSMINDAKYKKYIDRLKFSINTILSLQKNLKSFLKEIKSINYSTIDIYEILSRKIEIFKELYPDINFNLIEKNKLIIQSDKNLLERVLDNLISNACKYNNSKNPFVNIEIQKREIIIEDNGRGIENVDRVFDRYYKESQRGVGIGLSIVKKLCDELNIDISIESKVYNGTKVKLTFK